MRTIVTKSHLKSYKNLVILTLAGSVCLLITLIIAPMSWSASQSPAGQSAIRQASSTPPPDVAEMQKIIREQEKIPKTQPKATRQQLEDLIMKQEGGADRIKMAKTKTVPKQFRTPATSPPPDVVERGKLEKQQQNIPKAQSRATRQQLEELIMKQEGGAEKVKRAREGKPPTAQNWQGLRKWMASLNRFSVQTAHAQTPALSRDYKVSRPATMLGNNPNYFDLYSTSPYGYAYIPGTTIQYHTPSTPSAYVSSYPAAINLDGRVYTNYVCLSQQFPANGYYIVNLNGYVIAGTTIKLWHWGSTGYTNIKAFTNSVSGASNLPHLDYYTAGYHYFLWTIANGSFYMYQINVDSY